MTGEAEQIEAALLVTKVIADAIRELGAVPSGHLYVWVMNYLSLEQFNRVIDLLKDAGLVTETAHELRWVGPTNG